MTETLRSWPCWLLVAALALCVGIAVAWAGGTVEAQPSVVYYVDAAIGNDTSGDGTEFNPWKTITHAVNTVPAGNETYWRAIAVLPTGTYDEANGEVFPIVLDEEWVSVLGSGIDLDAGGVPDLLQNGESRLLQPRPDWGADVVGNGSGALFRIEAPFTGVLDFDMSNATCGVEATGGNFLVEHNTFNEMEYGVYVNIEEVDRATDFVFGGFAADEEEAFINWNHFNVTAAGVYVNLNLDFDASKTGLSATIGDIVVWSNGFYMDTTEGVSLNVTVADVTSGTVHIGAFEIGDASTSWKGNSFHGGTYGVHFDGRLEGLNSTAVTVDDIVVGNNDFYNQTDAAVLIDYYDSAHSGYADGWYGTTEVDFGPVVVVDNEIDSAEPGCDGIVVNFANWEYLDGEVLVGAEGILIEGNELDDSVPGYGIHVHYGPLGKFSGWWPEVDVGELDICLNYVHTTSASDGIYVHYDHCAQSLSEADVSFGDVDISVNTVDAGLDGIHVYYDECGSNMGLDAGVEFGALDISDNSITATSDGVYVHYYNTHGLNWDASVSWGAVTIEDNDPIDAGDNGIYLHYDNVGQDMWNGADVSICDVSIRNNDVVAAGKDGIYVHYYRVGYYEFMSGAGVSVGALSIVWNDIGTELSPVGDRGVEVYYNECGYYQEDDSVVSFGDVTCDYNTIFAGKDGVLAQYTDFGYALNDTAQTAAGSLTMEENTIEANFGNWTYSGVHVWCNGGFGHHLYGNSSVTRGDVAIRGNEVTRGYRGIVVDHFVVGKFVYDSADVGLGKVEIDGNTVSVSDWPVDLFYNQVAETMAADTLPCDATVVMDDVYIRDNTLSGETGLGVQIRYGDDHVAYDMHEEARAELPAFTVTGNTVNAGGGVAFKTIRNPSVIYGNATVDFGGLLIDDNTFDDQATGTGCGIDLRYEDFCDFCVGNSTATLGDIAVTNNRIYGVSSDAVCLRLLQPGCRVVDTTTVNLGDLAVSGNEIDGAEDGIVVDLGYTANLDTAGVLDIVGNDIGNATGSGVRLYVPPRPALMHSGEYAWYSHDDYDKQETFLTQTFDLANTTSPQLTFWHWYDIEELCDEGCVEVNDGPGWTWLGCYDGQSDGWEQATVDLSDYEGMEIELRFAYYGDSSIGHFGWLIDDIAISDIGFSDDVESGTDGWTATSSAGSTWSIISLGDIPLPTPNVSDNEVDGCGLHGIEAGDCNGIAVDGNTIRDSGDTGVLLDGLYGATITDNLLLDNGHGIYLQGCNTTDIQHNDILRNQGLEDSGIHFDANCGGTSTVNYNNIVANAVYGVFNDAGNEEVNAENNWWGNTSGPDDDDGVINGTGDAISTNVDADPWLGQQSYVSPYQQTASATGAGNATIQTDGGAIVDFQAVAEDSLPEEGKPDGVEFPYGFFSFKVIGLEPGQNVTVTLTLPGGNVTAGSLYWKHGPTLGNLVDHWFSLPLGDDDGDEVITIDLADGEDGDFDLAADGEIVEPGGPGTSPPAPSPDWTSPISLPSWGGLPIGTPTPQPQDGGNSTTPAEFNVSSLQISPAEVHPNEAVDVSFDVTNVGGSDGSYEAVLYVEGEAEGSQQVSVAAGETKGAFFAVSKAEPGNYQVSVGGESGWFTVVGAQTTGGGGLGTWAIAGIVIAAVVVLGAAAFLVVRRLRPAV